MVKILWLGKRLSNLHTDRRKVQPQDRLENESSDISQAIVFKTVFMNGVHCAMWLPEKLCSQWLSSSVQKDSQNGAQRVSKWNSCRFSKISLGLTQNYDSFSRIFWFSTSFVGLPHMIECFSPFIVRRFNRIVVSFPKSLFVFLKLRFPQNFCSLLRINEGFQHAPYVLSVFPKLF